MPGMHIFRITGRWDAMLPADLRAQRRNQATSRAIAVFPPASPSSTPCWAAASPKATACSWPALPVRARVPSACSSSPRASSQGEPGIVAIFEELPAEHVRRAAMFGIDFDTPQKDGKLKLIYLRPLDLSVDETVHEIVTAVKEIGCKRLVIDSLVGFEMALAPGFRDDFRESLYRMIAAFTRLGVTIITTVEIEEDSNSMDLSRFTVSFLADDILRMRYVSINGQFRKVISVVKMRRSPHSIDMHEYRITSQGVVIGEPMRGYRALTSVIPEPWSTDSGQNDPKLRADAAAATKKVPQPRPRKRGKRGRRSK